MTARELIEQLSHFDGDQEVMVALPGNRIERLDRLEADPYSDYPAVLLWPDTVEVL